MSNPDRVYWDSNTYIDYLTGEHELHDVMQLVIDDWQKGLVTLVTSALTIAEVYFVRVGVKKQVDRARDKDIDAFFDPPPGQRLIIVETSRLTAYRARDLARNASINGRDAIHVASAIEGKCPVMHTNDEKLWLKAGVVGGNPILRIEAPSWTHQLEAQEDVPSGKFTSLVDPSVPPQPPSLSPDDAPG